MGQLMERSQERAPADLELIFQLAQSDSKNVMLHGHMGQQTIAQETARHDPGGPRPDPAATAWTIFLLQLEMDRLPSQRFHIDHAARFATFVLQKSATVRTGRWNFHALDPIRLRRRDGGTAVSTVSRFGSAHVAVGQGRGIGFERPFGRRSRGTKETFLSGAFLITQAAFEPSVFFREAINRLLLFQAVRAIAQTVEVRG